MNSNSNVKQTYTLDDFVSASPSSQLSYYKLSLLELDSAHNIEYDVYNILSDYLPELRDKSVRITLTDEEYYTYRFRPKLLADYLYGNGELYFIILWLNDMWNVKDFDKKNINIIKRTDLSSLLSKINSSERNFIDSYNEQAKDN